MGQTHQIVHSRGRLIRACQWLLNGCRFRTPTKRTSCRPFSHRLPRRAESSHETVAGSMFAVITHPGEDCGIRMFSGRPIFRPDPTPNRTRARKKSRARLHPPRRVRLMDCVPSVLQATMRLPEALRAAGPTRRRRTGGHGRPFTALGLPGRSIRTARVPAGPAEVRWRIGAGGPSRGFRFDGGGRMAPAGRAGTRRGRIPKPRQVRLDGGGPSRRLPPGSGSPQGPRGPRSQRRGLRGRGTP